MDRDLAVSRIDEPTRALGVWVRRDEANRLWYVERSDIPGLNAEAASLDDLVEIIVDLAPDFIAANVPADNLPEYAVCVRHLVNARRARAV